jgi:hypothetical protein
VDQWVEVFNPGNVGVGVFVSITIFAIITGRLVPYSYYKREQDHNDKLTELMRLKNEIIAEQQLQIRELHITTRVWNQALDAAKTHDPNSGAA